VIVIIIIVFERLVFYDTFIYNSLDTFGVKTRNVSMLLTLGWTETRFDLRSKSRLYDITSFAINLPFMGNNIIGGIHKRIFFYRLTICAKNRFRFIRIYRGIKKLQSVYRYVLLGYEEEDT